MWHTYNCQYSMQYLCQEDRYYGNLSFYNITSTSMAFNWTPAPGPIDSYSVVVTSPAGSSQTITVGNVTETVVTGLSSSSVYTVQVFPSKCNIQLDPANGSACTAPPSPGWITVTNVGTNFVSLVWDAPSDMSSNSYSFLITYFSSYWGQSGSTNSSSFSATVMNLRAGSMYIFNVTTVNPTCGLSAPSSIAVYTNATTKILLLNVRMSSNRPCTKEMMRTLIGNRLNLLFADIYWTLGRMEQRCYGTPL
ncbi:tenascin-N-like [Erpetoichthys calabaricus]|uniref:tenascin-N-like n=1 Tax=Erpetoichthys calabaricus TaxID=27687 RepID=UPI002234B05B|nr:tenascin-N-like [Erpetoichthys calabaricus]